MAQTQSKKKKQSSIRSRASRRAPSPAPPSLTSLPRAASPTTEKAHLESTLSRPLETTLPTPLTSNIPALALTNTAGVHKRVSHKGKKLSAKQRKRREAGMMKGEAALEKLARKVEGGVERGGKVNERRVEWEKVNREVLEELGEVMVGDVEIEGGVFGGVGEVKI